MVDKQALEKSGPEQKKLNTASGDRDIELCHEDAQGGCPDDIAACGEEDIGAGLEELVTASEHEPKKSRP